jgi:hypothetical protein
MAGLLHGLLLIVRLPCESCCVDRRMDWATEVSYLRRGQLMRMIKGGLGAKVRLTRGMECSRLDGAP